MKKFNGLLIGLMGMLSACSFVSLNPDAGNVSVAVTKSDITACKFLGNTTVSIWAKSSTFQSQGTIEDQLDTLARNEAVSMHGNKVLAVSEIANGKRTYAVYDCPITNK